MKRRVFSGDKPRRSLDVAILLITLAAPCLAAEPWRRHAIDASSSGADGVRVADVNGDGRPDLVTGWEEGGAVCVCVHPGVAKVKQPWPSVTVGRVKSPEDAVFADLDGDGAVDVLSSTEGNSMSLFVHWAPRERERYLDPDAWKTEALPAAEKKSRWMFAAPLDIDGRHGVDLVVGSKEPGAMIGWLQAPADPRKLADWRLHPLCRAGWIMTLLPTDMDGDGDLDILLSDRKGPGSGVKWLENPGKTQATMDWAVHAVGGERQEVMFLCQADLDADGLQDIVCAVRPDTVLCLRRLSKDGRSWRSVSLPSPDSARAGTPKGVAVADINGDSRPEILMTCEVAAGPKSGVWAIEVQPFAEQPRPVYHDLGGPEGVKFDLIQMLDLDADGDLDLVTCEERDNLGVVWYENPLR